MNAVIAAAVLIVDLPYLGLRAFDDHLLIQGSGQLRGSAFPLPASSPVGGIEELRVLQTVINIELRIVVKRIAVLRVAFLLLPAGAYGYQQDHTPRQQRSRYGKNVHGREVIKTGQRTFHI